MTSIAYAVPYRTEEKCSVLYSVLCRVKLTHVALAIAVIIQCSLVVNGPGLRVKVHRKIVTCRVGNILTD
jgi:hypothetical protein